MSSVVAAFELSRLFAILLGLPRVEEYNAPVTGTSVAQLVLTDAGIGALNETVAASVARLQCAG